MAIKNNYNNIKITTTGIEEDLLLNADIIASIMRRYGYTEDSQYTALLTSGITGLDFMIFTSKTRFSINIIDYVEGELINNKVFVSGDFIESTIKSIKSESIITDAIFSYNIL